MEINRTLIPGSNWLYFKLYTGIKSADMLLTNFIYPNIILLQKNGLINKFFFIRYIDQHFHIRLRLHLSNREKFSKVLFWFYPIFSECINNGLLWNIQIDTYKRELERYGMETMELSEILFWHDSEMICKIILLEKVRQNENLRWLLGLKMIDMLLTDFSYSLQEKWYLLNTLKDNFGKEFGITMESRRQFGQKYRTQKKQIEKILNKDSEHEEEYWLLFQPIMEKTKVTKNLIEKIRIKIEATDTPSLNDLLSSYIHMMLNRLFRMQQRMHELVLYDYLFRYYTSQLARLKQKS